MDFHERELHIARIIAGYIEIDIGPTYRIYAPSLQDKYTAHKLYAAAYRDASFLGLMNEDDLLDMLLDLKLWSQDDQTRMDGLLKDIEELKVKIFQLTLRSNERVTVRATIRRAESEYETLYTRRHKYDYVTDVGYATLVHNQFLLLTSLKGEDGIPIFGPTVLDECNLVVGQLVREYSRYKLREVDIRELARNEPWRSIWSISGGIVNLFPGKPYDMTEEQRNLSQWSKIYDNIHESPDCPSNMVIDDDDMLDGWFITQKRKREIEGDQKLVDDRISNDRIRNSGEIYIMAETPEDVKKIDSMNDMGAIIAKKRRANLLKEKGELSEVQMPDVRDRLIQEMNKRSFESVKGRSHG